MVFTYAPHISNASAYLTHPRVSLSEPDEVGVAILCGAGPGADRTWILPLRYPPHSHRLRSASP